jgi:carboxylesterase type B
MHVSCSLRAILLFAAFLSISQAAFQANTTFGTLQGKPGSSPDTYSTCNEWLGIPYAEAPTGDNRLASTVPWKTRFPKGVRDALKYGFSCPQADALGSENCLFLNVWTPLENESDDELPVIIFIHGGSFISGSGGASVPGFLWDINTYDGCALAARYNMVSWPLAASTDESLTRIPFLRHLCNH